MKMINAFVFLNESLLEIETNIWHAPCTGKSNFTSRAYFRCFFFPSFIFLFFFLGKTDSYRKFLFSSFLAFSPFSEVVLHDVECFIVATSKKTDDPWKANIWESSGGDQNNEKRGQFVMSSETELLFLSITKRIEKARYSSKSFTELSLTRSSSLW